MSCCVYCCVVSVAVVWYCVVLTTGIRARSITRRYRCPTTHSPPSTVLLFDDRTRDVQLDPWDTGSGQGTGAATTHLVNPTQSIHYYPILPYSLQPNPIPLLPILTLTPTQTNPALSLTVTIFYESFQHENILHPPSHHRGEQTVVAANHHVVSASGYCDRGGLSTSTTVATSTG